MGSIPIFGSTPIKKEKMKKLLALSIGALVLSACGTKTIVVEKSPDTTIYEAPITTPVNDEQNYIEGVTADFPSEVSKLGKVQIIELGRLMCDAIDEGITIQNLVAMSSTYNVDPGFIGAVVREAVENFCPDNQWFIDSVLNA